MQGKKKAGSSAHRVRALVDRVTDSGGRRMSVLLSAEANKAAADLLEAGYAASATKAICRALVDARDGSGETGGGLVLDEVTARAAEHLQGCGYAYSIEAVVARALADAARVRGFS